MKTRALLVIAAALLISLTALPALAQGEAKLKAEAQAFLDNVAASIEKKDLPAVAATMAPQAVFKFQNGQTWTVAQWQEVRAKEFADMQEIKSRFVVEKAWPKGKGLAGMVYRETHDFTRPSDPGHKYTIKSHQRAYLTQTPQGWRTTQFVDLGTQVLKDGRPLTAPAKKKAAAKPQS